MGSITDFASRVKPLAPGTCAWVQRPQLPEEPGQHATPGRLHINGRPYQCDLSVLFPSESPEIVAVRLTSDQHKVYDLDLSGPYGWTCDCGDFTFRRDGNDPQGCKHCRALRVLLPLILTGDFAEKENISLAQVKRDIADTQVVRGGPPAAKNGSTNGTVKGKEGVVACVSAHEVRDARRPVPMPVLYVPGQPRCPTCSDLMLMFRNERYCPNCTRFRPAA